MDKLIEDYKKELIEDEACGYGYPTGLKNRIIKEIESNKFAIPVEKVQAMIDSVRKENTNTSDSGLHLQRVSNSLHCPNCKTELQLEVNEMTNSEILMRLQ